MDATTIPETATLARDMAQTAMKCSGVVGLDEENIAPFGVGPPVRGVRVITDEDARLNISIDILAEEGPNITDVTEVIHQPNGLTYARPRATGARLRGCNGGGPGGTCRGIGHSRGTFETATGSP